MDLAGIDQAIYGGESGPSARPCDLAWIRRGVASCRKSGTAVFVKQLGSRPIYDLGDGHRDEARTRPVPLRDRAGADPFEWPEDLRDARAFPRGPA